MTRSHAMLTVSRVAALSGLTVRTLHHYDRIGLVKPRLRSEAGYRLYTRDDLARLQQVLLFRELGFPLRAIRRIMTASSFDQRRALSAQRTLLVEKRQRVEAMLAAIDRRLGARGGNVMDDQGMFGMFGDFDPKRYEEEVTKRWGQAPQHAESSRRTARYGKADWAAIKQDADAIVRAAAATLREGVPANDPRAMAIAERHRQHIDKWFYPCPPEMHANLGRMYVADERFAANYERVAPGLAVYMRDAIIANAARS